MISPRSHRLLLGAVALLIFGQVVAFWPSSTPSETPASDEPKPSSQAPKSSTFKGFSPPPGVTPDYSIRNFRYVSVADGKKQWQLKTSEAQFFSKQETMLTTDVEAELFSDDASRGPSIRVKGREARYRTNTRDLEVGGTVVAQFPDGSEIQSEFLKYIPSKRLVLIPAEYAVSGKGPRQSSSRLKFRSLGLEGRLESHFFSLPSAVEIQIVPSGDGSKDQPTTFRAARADLSLPKGEVSLISDPSSAGREPVSMEQRGNNRLVAYARTMNLQLSEKGSSKKTSFTATEDVRIEEWQLQNQAAKKPYRYSTSGKAEFFPDESIFLLTEYPQVYQDNDTMTGDFIKIDRKKDEVEVENSNAITSGNYE